jgi:hypothetical protein
MSGDQFVARKRTPPIALAARDKYDLTLFVGEPKERSLDGEIGAQLALASARVRKHVGPPFFTRGLLRVRPRAVFDSCLRLDHRLDQPGNIGLAGIEQDEIRRHAATVLIFQHADRA